MRASFKLAIPAFAMTVSRAWMLWADFKELMPWFMESEDETSNLMVMRLEPDALGREFNDCESAADGSRTVATTTVFGVARYAVTSPLPMPTKI